MRVGSICSGISADSVAWSPLGWTHEFFAEIDPYCCALLKHYYPEVPNLGDMTKINGREWRGKIDVLMGSTPCQAFSVAGNRKSLQDKRGNLTLTFTELVHAIEPRYTVWENVPGVLSTADNAFGCFLAALIGADDPLALAGDSSTWPCAGMVSGPLGRAAWRVLDAQFFGLAQRRQRVFLVFCPGDGPDPGAVLFERPRLLGNPPTRGEAREDITGTLASRTSGGGGLGTDFGLGGGIQLQERSSGKRI